MASDKDTIYIDIDDEITGIIDKVRGSDGKIVALVLPKRASVFQSIVNMKLLKRAADAANKHLVLITTEAGLLPLAGAAGVHVAKSLTSAPAIPGGPSLPEEDDEAVPEDSLTDEEPAVDPNKPVGELAGATAGAAAADGVETLVMDDEEPAPEEAAAAAPKKADKVKKDKKLRVPDFNRFRLWLLLGGLALVLLIILFIVANSVLNKATINIKTDASTVNTSLDLNLSTAAKSLDAASSTIPAKLAQQQKTYSQQVATTGQKNTGNKASGSVVFYNCYSPDTLAGQNETIPAGTGISNNGQTYITQQSVDVPPSHFNGSTCKSDQASDSVPVIAQAGGTSSNIGGNSSFTVSYANPSAVANHENNTHTFSAKTGSGISGGTDNIVRSVNQNDINNAKAKITADNNTTMQQALSDDLKKDNYFAIGATFQAGTPNITTSSNVGDTADNVTVTETIVFTMFGVPQNDLKTLVENDIKGQIDTSKQSILDNGIDKAVFNVNNISATAAQLSMSDTAAVGPDLNTAAIAKSAAGKKPGEVKSDLGNDPDVVSVDVKLSPFWVSSVPKNTSHIKVNIAKPASTKASNGN